MLNNFWEELRMKKEIHDFHSKKIENMDLPNWIKDIKCPFCHNNVLIKDIRKISLCLNTRNLGEIAIEVACTQCEKMDTLYYITSIKNISEFILYLDKKEEPKIEPIIEEKMYEMKYNNLISEMVLGKNGQNNN